MQTFTNRLTRSLSLAVLSAVLLTGAVACGSDDDDPTPTPDASPTTPAPTSPPGETPTPEPTIPAGPIGDPGLDPIAEAFDDGDIDGLLDLTKFLELACVEKVEGAGGPPQCPAGVPAGTFIKVLAMSQCEGYYVLEADLEASYTTLLANGFSLYAAFDQTDPGTEAFPTGDKVILFEEGSTGFGRMVNVEDGKVVSITSVCGASPAQVIEARNITSFILEPAA